MIFVKQFIVFLRYSLCVYNLQPKKQLIMRYTAIIITSFFLLQAPPLKSLAQATSKKHSFAISAKELSKKIAQWQQDLNIPNVAVGIIDNGKIETAEVFGKDINGKPAPANMLFEIASVTKVVFTTLVLKLVEAKKWNLDEPLYHYYTDTDVTASPYSKLLTTRHVLSQQSGFDNWRWMNETGKLVFNFKPGTKFNYSGEGLEYLRLAIEHKFNKPLEVLADSILFKPWHMTDTHHAWDSKQNFNRYAHMYDVDGKEIVKTDYSIQASAAAGITTTKSDMCRFGLEVLKGAQLSPALYKEMVTPQVAINPNLNQGLGWRVINLSNGEYALQHAGNDGGVAALMVLLPKTKRGVIVLTNADNGLVMCNNIARVVFAEGPEIIHKAYKSGKISDTPPAFAMKESELKEYTGDFKRADGVEVTVTVKNGGLVLRMTGIPLLNLIPQQENKFYLADMDVKITFDRDDDNKVEAVTIIDGANTIKCKKVAD